MLCACGVRAERADYYPNRILDSFYKEKKNIFSSETTVPLAALYIWPAQFLKLADEKEKFLKNKKIKYGEFNCSCFFLSSDTGSRTRVSTVRAWCDSRYTISE